MGEIIVRVIDLPDSVSGVTVLDENGDYNIYLNGRLSYDSYNEAVKHELRHINKEHFYIDKPIPECEDEAKKE